MHDRIVIFKFWAAGMLGSIAMLLGGADIWLYTLIGFVGLDYITGLVKAVITKTLISKIAFNGGLRKILIFVVVGVATALDTLLLSDTPILRSLAVGYYIATEGLSILENIGQCGVPYPAKLLEILDALKKRAEDGGEDGDE